MTDAEMPGLNERECRRCGKCCEANMFAYITREDILKWRSQSRNDLIEIAESGETVWAGDRIMSSSKGEYTDSCPFLGGAAGMCTCIIYESRPGVCAAYRPGSSPLCPQWTGGCR
jgi:Fe-S-cluster containining protein